MNNLEVYIDLLEKSDLVTGVTSNEWQKQGDFIGAALTEKRSKNVEKIIIDLKKIKIN